jgi:hypothetical protein
VNVTPINLQQYIDALKSVKLASPFHLPQYHYLRELINPAEYRFTPLKIERNGKTLLIPVIVRERRKGYREFTVPFNSIASNQPTIEESDYLLEFEALRVLRPFQIKIATCLQNPDSFPNEGKSYPFAITRKVTYIVHLPSRYEDWFFSLSSKTRQLTRKAEKEGVTVRKKGKDGLAAFIPLFYRRFSDNPAMLTTWPLCFFDLLFGTMPPGSVFFYEALLEDEVIASTLFLVQGKECFAHSGVFNDKFPHYYANYLIHAQMIRDLIREGYEIYNLGGVAGSHSLAVYKERFNANPVYYYECKWKDRFLSLRNSFRLPKPLRKIKVERLLLMKKDLKNDEIQAPSIPPAVDWFAIAKEEGLEKLINEGYDLDGRDERGKFFMSEKIAKNRLAQKKTLFLGFWKKILVHSRCGVHCDSLSHARMIPPVPLSANESFLENANTSVFYRKLGYHKLFLMTAAHFLKERGFEKVYGTISQRNVPAVKALTRTGFHPIGTFYLLRWKKRYWCVGTRKLIRTMKKDAFLSIL